VAVGLLALVFALATAACASNPSGGSPGGDSASDAAGIEVPDVTGDDGADALSSVEDAGLTATLADANDEDRPSGFKSKQRRSRASSQAHTARALRLSHIATAHRTLASARPDPRSSPEATVRAAQLEHEGLKPPHE
jgi:hypothetical protein